MKLMLSVMWQTVVLYAAAFAGFVVGVAVPSLRVSRVTSQTAGSLTTYDFDWLIAVLLVYGLLLLLGAARGRMRRSWLATTIALAVVIAAVLLFTRLGIKQTAL